MSNSGNGTHNSFILNSKDHWRGTRFNSYSIGASRLMLLYSCSSYSSKDPNECLMDWYLIWKRFLFVSFILFIQLALKTVFRYSTHPVFRLVISAWVLFMFSCLIFRLSTKTHMPFWLVISLKQSRCAWKLLRFSQISAVLEALLNG